MPNGFTIVNFAYDIVIVSVAKTAKELKEKLNIAFRKVEAWLDEVGLTLTQRKSEAVLISDRKIVEKLKVTVGGSGRGGSFDVGQQSSLERA